MNISLTMLTPGYKIVVFSLRHDKVVRLVCLLYGHLYRTSMNSPLPVGMHAVLILKMLYAVSTYFSRHSLSEIGGNVFLKIPPLRCNTA
jgi:hypothetical protein